VSVADAFAPIEEKYRNQVMAETFGHLAPQPRQKYSGEILFTHGEYGDIVVIKNTIDIDDSPWFFEDMQQFVAGYIVQGRDTYVNRTKIESGAVYRFTGHYTKFKNGNCRFSGKITKVV
jgi:hypothetical protein